MAAVIICMIVADASPLILLARSDLLQAYLDGLGEPVAVASAVANECRGHPDSFDALLIASEIERQRLEVHDVDDRGAVDTLRAQFRLGLGEAETIILARRLAADVVLIEDRSGVNACKLLRLPFSGVLGILVRMHEREMISSQEALGKLQALERFGRYGSGIIEDVRRRLEG